MSSADVTVEGPSALGPSDQGAVQPPEFNTTSVRVDRWIAKCVDGDCDRQLVTACFSSRVSAWSPEVATLVHDKLDETARNTAFRARGDGAMALHGVSAEGDIAVRELQGDERSARTFLAFTRDPDVVHACFVLSISDGEAGRDWVQHAHVRGPVQPAPEASVSLTALSACVHHPKHAAGGALAIVVALSIAAIVRRPGRRYSRRAP